MSPLSAARYIPRIPYASPGGEPPPSEPPTGVFDLSANTSFDPENPTIKTGQAFTQEMEDIYAGLINYYVNGIGVNGKDSATNVPARLDSGNSYNIGRDAFRQLACMLVFFRLTGDLRLLDKMAQLADIAYNSMWTGGSNGTSWYPGAIVGRTFHGKRTWVSLVEDPSTFPQWGTDNHDTDTARAFNAIAPIAYALDLNRGETSPAGLNYGTLADKWIAAFEGYEQVWTSGAWDASWPANSDVPATYEGYLGTRPAEDDWPTNKRTFTHTNLGVASLNYYMAKLLGKTQAVTDAVMDDILAPFVNDEMYFVDGPGSTDLLVWPRAYTSMTTSNTYIHPVTYAEYVILDLVGLWLDGNPDSLISTDDLAKAARSFSTWVLYTGNPDAFSVKADMGGGVARTGTNRSGITTTLPDACSGGGFCTDRTRDWWALGGHNLLIAFEPADTNSKLYTWGKEAFLDLHTTDGTYNTMRSLAVPAGIFLRDALDLASGTGNANLPTWSLAIDSSFNTSSPTFKDGTILAGEALSAYQGLIYYGQNPSTNFGGSTDALAGSDNLYQMGRDVRDRMQAMFVALRLTGDARFLDFAVRWGQAAKARLAVGYRGTNPSTPPTTTASPYLCWVVRGTAFGDIEGTDLTMMNEVKWHAAIAELAYACYVNRDETSPAGYDYRAEYQYWLGYLENNFVPKWSGGGTTDWRNDYRGIRRTPTYERPYRRAGTGEWPLVVNGGEDHSSVSSTHLAYYYYKLTGSQNALAEFSYLTDLWVDVETAPDLQLDPGIGYARPWPHTMSSQGSPAHYGQGATYAPYEMADMASMYLEEGYSAKVNVALLQQMAHAYTAFCLLNAATGASGGDIMTAPDIIGGSARGTLTVYSSFSGRSQYQVANNPHTILAAWDPGTEIYNAAKNLSAKSWAGPLTQAKVPFPAISLLLYHAIR